MRYNVGRLRVRSEKMNTIETMNQKGIEHAKAGKTCTPFDCQTIDKELFSEMRNHDHPAQWYARMRSAFNTGWQIEYCRMVGI
jgi:transketolase